MDQINSSYEYFALGCDHDPNSPSYKHKDKIDQMIEYYLSAIRYGDDKSMVNLALYYEGIGDHDNMYKYNIMGIEKNNSNCMNNLGCFYRDYYFKYLSRTSEIEDLAKREEIKKMKKECLENMFKYYIMAFDNGNIISRYNLGEFYENYKEHKTELEKEKYELLMVKYYSMAADEGDLDASNRLDIYYWKK